MLTTSSLLPEPPADDFLAAPSNLSTTQIIEDRRQHQPCRRDVNWSLLPKSSCGHQAILPETNGRTLNVSVTA